MDYGTHHKSFNYTSHQYSNNLVYDSYDATNVSTRLYRNDDITVMVYVDDLLILGEDDKIKEFLQRLQGQLDLKHITKLERGQPLVCLGRQIDSYNGHIALSMTKEYYNSLLSLYNIKENTNSLSTTGTKRPPITTGELLNSEEHSIYRTIVGKLLWMCPLRPDIQYATKNLTRAVQKAISL
eukprot:5291601-Amphidinium_carterae.1